MLLYYIYITHRIICRMSHVSYHSTCSCLPIRENLFGIPLHTFASITHCDRTTTPQTDNRFHWDSNIMISVQLHIVFFSQIGIPLFSYNIRRIRSLTEKSPLNICALVRFTFDTQYVLSSDKVSPTRTNVYSNSKYTHNGDTMESGANQEFRIQLKPRLMYQHRPIHNSHWAQIYIILENSFQHACHSDIQIQTHRLSFILLGVRIKTRRFSIHGASSKCWSKMSDQKRQSVICVNNSSSLNFWIFNCVIYFLRAIDGI